MVRLSATSDIEQGRRGCERTLVKFGDFDLKPVADPIGEPGPVAALAAADVLEAEDHQPLVGMAAGDFS